MEYLVPFKIVIKDMDALDKIVEIFCDTLKKWPRPQDHVQFS